MLIPTFQLDSKTSINRELAQSVKASLKSSTVKFLKVELFLFRTGGDLITCVSVSPAYIVSWVSTLLFEHATV